MELKSNSADGLSWSGWFPSIPVTSGHGPPITGQKLDKSTPDNSSKTWPFSSGFFLAIGLPSTLLLGIFLQGAKAKRTIHLEAMRAESEEEITQMHSLYLTALGTPPNQPTTAIYSRFSSDKQSSVPDQVRACLAFALKEKLYVPRELIFADFAITGRKESRPALNELREAINRGEAKALLVLSTNRLFRGLYSCLKFVNEFIVGRDVRFVAVDRGLDSANEKTWRLVLNLLAIMDELASTLYQGNIRAAHMSRALRAEVWGTLAFGYCFSAVDDSGNPLSRRIYRIDQQAAEWVKKIFTWFAVDGIDIAQIVRRLCAAPDVPVPPWSRTGVWSRPVVSRLLRNARYRGDWSYGWFDRIWNTAKDCLRVKRREEPLQRLQIETLRIIDEPLWNLTQARIAENKADRGRPNKDGKRNPYTYLLKNLLHCKFHDQVLYRSGPPSKAYFRCKICETMDEEARPLFSYLNGETAVTCLVEAMRKAVANDDELVETVIAACQAAVAQQSQPDPSELASLESAVKRLTNSINLLVDNPGDCEADRRESATKLKRLRAERSGLLVKVENYRQSMKIKIAIPSAEEVRDALKRLASRIERLEAGHSFDEDALARLRSLLRRFTGGTVMISQAGERQSHQGWLKAEFQCNVVGQCIDELCGGDVAPIPAREMEVEIRRPDPNAELAKEIIRLRDSENLTFARIGQLLNMTRNRASRIYFKFVPDSDSKKVNSEGTQIRYQSERPLPERVADEVMALLEEGLLCAQVCKRLGICKETLTDAKRHWYQSRGLAFVDGRSRRKQLSVKSRPREKAKSV